MKGIAKERTTVKTKNLFPKLSTFPFIQSLDFQIFPTFPFMVTISFSIQIKYPRKIPMIIPKIRERKNGKGKNLWKEKIMFEKEDERDCILWT